MRRLATNRMALKVLITRHFASPSNWCWRLTLTIVTRRHVTWKAEFVVAMVEWSWSNGGTLLLLSVKRLAPDVVGSTLTFVGLGRCSIITASPFREFLLEYTHKVWRTHKRVSCLLRTLVISSRRLPAAYFPQHNYYRPSRCRTAQTPVRKCY